MRFRKCLSLVIFMGVVFASNTYLASPSDTIDRFSWDDSPDSSLMPSVQPLDTTVTTSPVPAISKSWHTITRSDARSTVSAFLVKQIQRAVDPSTLFTMRCPAKSIEQPEILFDRCPAILGVLFGAKRCLQQCSCTPDGYMTCTTQGIPAGCHATSSDVIDFCLSYGERYPACSCDLTPQAQLNGGSGSSRVEQREDLHVESRSDTLLSRELDRQQDTNISSISINIVDGGSFELTCAGPGMGYIGFIQTCPTDPETVEPLTGNKCTTWCECDNTPGKTRGQIVCPRAEGRGGLCGGGSGYGYTDATENFCRAGTRSFQCQCLVRYRDAVEV